MGASPDPEHSMLRPRSQIGRYTIRQRIGAGGMGDVYLAFDPNLERPVAVKVLSDELSGDAKRLARFAREAKAASALNHPNIITVHDFAEHDGIHFLVTEYVDGRTLREWAGEGRAALVEVLDVMAQAASALAAAHAAGIVHRDVKPENLMLRPDGLVKVLDFGIAKLVAARAGGGAHDQTEPGTVLGTRRYMSPEQAVGAVVDARSDVWSLGVVVYELVAGRPPFDAPTPMGIMMDIVGREPEPLGTVAPETPESVRGIVARALSKEPGERYATAAEMAVALTRVARDLGQGGGGAYEVRTRAPGASSFPTEVAAPPTNLPPRAPALVGRGRELAEVTAMLGTPAVRLLTLTGPGGTGKTRLAIEAAHELADTFVDGAFAVDLSMLADAELLAAHVAQAFGLKEVPGVSLADALGQYLASRRLLLVLDNFEHLLSGATLVARLLAAAPGVTALVTSRAPLHLSAEREYAVEPLEVPVFTSLPPLDELGRAPAVELFVERARAVKPSFALTADNARAVAEICQRLDGLPLAIELAAARVKVLAPAAMLERLDNRLKILTGGARDLPGRQQTMRGAVAWSYDLLDEGERALFSRLAVFAGGATLGAAEAVCGWDGLDVLDTVSSLVDKSLLRQRDDEDGEARFTMLEVVREYALEQLEASGEAAAVRLEHARYFQRFAVAASPGIRGADQAVWVGRLAREDQNLVAALVATFEREPSEGAAFVLSLAQFWSIRGRMTEKRDWLRRGVEAEGVAPAERTMLLSGLGYSEFEFGNRELGARYSREAVATGRGTGDPHVLAVALNGLGVGLMCNGDLESAVAAFEEGLAIAREADDQHIAAVLLDGLGEAARVGGDLAAARSYYEQAVEVVGRHARAVSNAVALGNLGGLSLEVGDFAVADGYYRESLTIAVDLGDPFSTAVALDGLAAVALEGGDRARAARLAGAAEALYETASAPLEAWEQALRDRCVSALRLALDAETLEREWARGRLMTLDEAARAALEGEDLTTEDTE
jgi:non-specific serine/threonine protein kinase